MDKEKVLDFNENSVPSDSQYLLAMELDSENKPHSPGSYPVSKLKEHLANELKTNLQDIENIKNEIDETAKDAKLSEENAKKSEEATAQYARDAKSTLDTHTEAKKKELDAYAINVVEPAIVEYTNTNIKPDLDASVSNASQSASSASQSAANASSSESNANQSANSASASATSASSSATSASQSASDASNSKTQAETAANTAVSAKNDAVAAKETCERLAEEFDLPSVTQKLSTLETAIDNVETSVSNETKNRTDADTALQKKITLLEQRGGHVPGEVYWWSGTQGNRPTRSLPCNGAAVSRTTYADLYAKIGTKYGSGNGSTTFNVPNLMTDGNGRFIRAARNDSEVGAKENDTIRGITGSSTWLYMGYPGESTNSGVLYGEAGTQSKGMTGGNDLGKRGYLKFDASRSVPTSIENRPYNIRFLPLISY